MENEENLYNFLERVLKNVKEEIENEGINKIKDEDDKTDKINQVIDEIVTNELTYYYPELEIKIITFFENNPEKINNEDIKEYTTNFDDDLIYDIKGVLNKLAQIYLCLYLQAVFLYDGVVV